MRLLAWLTDFFNHMLFWAGRLFDALDEHEGAVTAFATVVIAWFTAALAYSTKKLWQETKTTSEISDKTAAAALKNAQAVETAERAYVKISHHPPGLIFPAHPLAPLAGFLAVQMVMKNLGQTPATITDKVMRDQVGGSLPMTPDYPPLHTRDQAPHLFLYSDDPSTHWVQFEISGQDMTDIQNGTKTWFLYGYVDYIDQFGQRHRAGYGRFYERRADDESAYPSHEEFLKRSNLFFITQRGYNYDRKREKGEGNDWSEQPN